MPSLGTLSLGDSGCADDQLATRSADTPVKEEALPRTALDFPSAPSMDELGGPDVRSKNSFAEILVARTQGTAAVQLPAAGVDLLLSILENSGGDLKEAALHSGSQAAAIFGATTLANVIWTSASRSSLADAIRRRVLRSENTPQAEQARARTSAAISSLIVGPAIPVLVSLLSDAVRQQSSEGTAATSGLTLLNAVASSGAVTVGAAALYATNSSFRAHVDEQARQFKGLLGDLGAAAYQTARPIERLEGLASRVTNLIQSVQADFASRGFMAEADASESGAQKAGQPSAPT